MLKNLNKLYYIDFLLRIHFARGGISMPNNFSTANEYACSLHIIET